MLPTNGENAPISNTASAFKVGCDRLLKNTEALARAEPDGEDRGTADHGDPEAALLRIGGRFG
jgi:hypothetical protein